MGRKNKLDLKTRLKAVKEYVEGSDSAVNIARRYGLNERHLRYLGRVYRVHGPQGLETRKFNQSYTPQFKQMVVLEYLEGGISFRELAIQHKMPSGTQISDWIREYNGHKTLKGYNTWGGKRMTKGRKTSYEERIGIVEDCLKNGQDYQASAEKFGVSYHQIYSWVKKYHAHGVAGLKDSRGKGKDLEDMSEVTGAARSGYYKWLRRPEPIGPDKEEWLQARVLDCCVEHKGIYGVRRIALTLCREVVERYNVKRVRRIMRRLGLSSVIRRKRKNYIPSTPQITAQNILARDFTAQKPNQKWLTDVTELKYGIGQKAYHSAILDLGDNSIVSCIGAQQQQRAGV